MKEVDQKRDVMYHVMYHFKTYRLGFFLVPFVAFLINRKKKAEHLCSNQLQTLPLTHTHTLLQRMVYCRYISPVQFTNQ